MMIILISSMSNSSQKTITLLDECHHIVDEQDIALTHDLVECMFYLLDLNSLEQLQDIITNQFEEYTR